MQPLTKSSKIIISVLVLLISVVAIFFALYFRGNDKTNLLKNIVQKNPADELLEENGEALKKAEEYSDGIVRKIDNTDYILGNINAPVEIIIYDDFDNEFSVDYFQTIKKVVDTYADKVVIAYRNFPMRSHRNSGIAAMTAECAGEQKLFWEMAEKLFAAKSADKLDEENINLIAAELKLDQKQFTACLTDNKYSDKIQKLLVEADGINVTGTPTTFVNKIPYPGAMPFEDFTDSSGLERKGLASVVNGLIDR